MKPPFGHRQIDHTADLAFEFWAPSKAGVFVQGARALVEVLAGDTDVPVTGSREVELDAVDDEDCLVAWLNEVLYLATVEGFVVAEADLTLEPGRLSATVRGQAEAAHRVAAELKSVTHHGLVLEENDEGWVGRVVVDV